MLLTNFLDKAAASCSAQQITASAPSPCMGGTSNIDLLLLLAADELLDCAAAAAADETFTSTPLSLKPYQNPAIKK